MSENELISIVLTTHEGRKEMCERAIKSVINQTYKNWELIIVDDASNDGTDKMVDTFNDARITYFKRKTCFGNDTQPKNDGTKLAKGNLVAYLDSDNEYYPDHLMILYKESQKNPEVDVLYGDRLAVDDTGKMDPQIGLNADFRIDIIAEMNFIDTSDVLIKKQALYDVGGWDERYSKYIDWNLFLRMAKAQKKFLHIPKVISTYHLHKEMKSLLIHDDQVGKSPLGISDRTFKPKWDPMELEIVLPFLGKRWQPSVAIYTLTMNRLDLTKKMYASLQKSGYPFDWFVVDNGSTDGTVKWLMDKARTLILNPENKGISIASNQALDAIGQDYDIIIKIDNDCEMLSENWLKKLLPIFESQWMILVSPYVEGLIENAGGTPRLAYKNFKGHALGLTSHIGGIFTMAHKSAYEHFRWDTDDFLHGLQDLVFTRAMEKKGYLCAYVEDMRCAHQLTTEEQKKVYPEYFEKRKYERTHSYQPTEK